MPCRPYCGGWRSWREGNAGISTNVSDIIKFSELARLLERDGFELIKEKGSVRYYAKAGLNRLIRLDYHGSKEIPTGTCDAILKAAGLKGKGGKR
jgi:predicted RNA binding protein YcfA (HicA-like mRNA interferase family)